MVHEFLALSIFKGASSWKASSVVAKVTDQAAICLGDKMQGATVDVRRFSLYVNMF